MSHPSRTRRSNLSQDDARSMRWSPGGFLLWHVKTDVQTGPTNKPSIEKSGRPVSEATEGGQGKLSFDQRSTMRTYGRKGTGTRVKSEKPGCAGRTLPILSCPLHGPSQSENP